MTTVAGQCAYRCRVTRRRALAPHRRKIRRSITPKGKLEGSRRRNCPRYGVARRRARRNSKVLPADKALVRAQADRDYLRVRHTSARESRATRKFVWIGPIATNLWAVYGRGDFAPSIRTLKDLSPYRISTVARDPKAEFLRENGVTDVRAFRDDALNPQRLFLARDNPQRIDLWITDLHSGRLLASRQGDRHQARVHRFGSSRCSSPAAHGPTTTIVKALTEALDTIKEDGSFKRITANCSAFRRSGGRESYCRTR